MKVLFLTPQLPYPPTKGASLRNFHLIKGLAASHEVHLLTFLEPGNDPTNAAPLRDLCVSIAAVPAPKRSMFSRLASLLLSGSPDMASRLASSEFAGKLDGALKSIQPDALQIEGIELARYYLNMPYARGPAVVLDQHNAEYLMQKRAFAIDARQPGRLPEAVYSLIQWQKLKSYERMACNRAAAVISVSEEDRRAILALDPSLDITVIPNGVDTAYFQPSQKTADLRLLFSGTMDFRPNVDAMVWFVREVLPLIRRELPEVRLSIVGGRPTERVKALAGDSVEVTGFVEDVRPHMTQAAGYVIPMRMGGGVRFKALEAMSCGMPLVSTSLGVEGIAVKDGAEAFIADDAQSFATATVRLLMDRQLGEGMGKRGRSLVESQYDWNLVTPRLAELYQRLFESKASQ